MNIAYSCLGRAWNLDPAKASTVGGDMDRIRLLMRLAWDHPEHNFILVGRNSGEDPATLGYPDNVKNPWVTAKMPPVREYDDIKADREKFMEWLIRGWRPIMRELPKCGAHIMWAGQHGGSNSPLPMIDTDWDDNKLTTPQMAFMNYCAYLLDYCNETTVEPLVLCPDPRNYWKARELVRPFTRPVLAQYNMTRVSKHEQFQTWARGDYKVCRDKVPGTREKSVYVTNLDYKYAAVEMTALDEPQSIMCNVAPPSIPFGVVSNENRKEVNPSRFDLIKQIHAVMGTFKLYGSWSDPSAQALYGDCGIEPCTPVPATSMYETLRQFRSTVTLPASGSGWATAKPWECFAAGVVCFFYGKYDEQGHVIATQDASPAIPGVVDRRQELHSWLGQMLRVRNASELAKRVDQVKNSDDLWHAITNAQREYFELSFNFHRGGARAVEEALGL